MAWKAKTGKEADRLMRIVARLFALADLAERAAGRSFLVRWLVLWSLCHADAAARDFVVDTTSNAAGRRWSPALMPPRYGSDPADAMYLAASLRSLALIVHGMVAELCRVSFLQQGALSDETGNANGAGGRPTSHDVQAGALRAPARHDTS